MSIRFNVLMRRLVDEAFHAPEHELLTPVVVRELYPTRIFVTKSGKVFQGGAFEIENQLSLSVRQFVHKEFIRLIDKEGQMIEDYHPTHESLETQREHLEQTWFFTHRLHLQICSWLLQYDERM